MNEEPIDKDAETVKELAIKIIELFRDNTDKREVVIIALLSALAAINLEIDSDLFQRILSSGKAIHYELQKLNGK